MTYAVFHDNNVSSENGRLAPETQLLVAIYLANVYGGTTSY